MPQKAGARTIRRIERRRQAFALRMGGATYVEIAGALGVSHQAAHKLVTTTLQETRTKLFEDIESVREVEVRRTEALVMGLWPNRQQPRVADTILRILERRARLLGLDAPTRIDERIQAAVRFEVITGVEGPLGSLLPAPESPVAPDGPDDPDETG